LSKDKVLEVEKEETAEVEEEIIERDPRPERPALAIVLMILPVLIILAGFAILCGVLSMYFLHYPLGPEWVINWGRTIQGVLGAAFGFYCVLTFGGLLAGLAVRAGLSPDQKPESFLGKMMGVGDTAVSMGLIAAAFLGLTCARGFMSQYAPDALMGTIDQTSGYVTRLIVALIYAALSFGLMLTMMRLRTAWQEVEYMKRNKERQECPELERYRVILEYVPIEKKSEIVRMLRQYIGVDQATARGLINAAPVKVLEDANVEDATMLVDLLMQEDARARKEVE